MHKKNTHHPEKEWCVLALIFFFINFKRQCENITISKLKATKNTRNSCLCGDGGS